MSRIGDVIQLQPKPTANVAERSWADRLQAFFDRRWMWFTRSRRILACFLAIWLIHAMDLRFTVGEAVGGDFVELNPVAEMVLGHSFHAVIIYKFAMVGGGCILLWLVRRHAIAEQGAWLMLAMSIFLMAQWYAYFETSPECPEWYYCAFANR